MSRQLGNRISIRDCVLEELRKDYPELKLVKKRDPFSYSVWFKRMDFKTGWDLDEFLEGLRHVKSRYCIRRKGNGILIEISKFTGYLERRQGDNT